MTTEDVRIERGLIAAAEAACETSGLSVSVQITRWARLGRALESSLDPASPIGAVLAKQGGFDALDDESQRAVAALWDIRMQEARANLDLAAEFEASGRAYAFLDQDGNAVYVPGRPPRDVGESRAES